MIIRCTTSPNSTPGYNLVLKLRETMWKVQTFNKPQTEDFDLDIENTNNINSHVVHHKTEQTLRKEKIWWSDKIWVLHHTNSMLFVSFSIGWFSTRIDPNDRQTPACKTISVWTSKVSYFTMKPLKLKWLVSPSVQTQIGEQVSVRTIGGGKAGINFNTAQSAWGSYRR